MRRNTIPLHSLIWIGLLVLVLGLLNSPGRVQAHAVLLFAEPRSFAVLDTWPRDVALTFNEPLSSATIVMHRPGGQSTEEQVIALSAATPDVLRIPLPDDWRDGVLTIEWSVVSAVDGHLSRGIYAIAVGVRPPDFGPIASSDIDLGEAVVRMIWLIGLLISTGTLLMQALLVRDDDRWRFVMGSGWILVAVSIALRGNPGWVTITWSLTAFALWRDARRIALVGMFLTALLLALRSHAVTAPDVSLTLFARVGHLFAMIVWISGLITLFVQVSKRKNLISTFRLTRWMRFAVGMLIVTGVYQAWAHVGGWPALLTTQYGQILSLKLLVFIPALLLGAYHEWIKRPIPAMLGIEITLVLAALGFASVLSATVPSRTLAESAQLREIRLREYILEQDIAAVHVHLTLEPGSVGENAVEVLLANRDTGRVITGAAVTVFVEGAEAGVSMTEEGRGFYTIPPQHFATAADYSMRVVVERTGQPPVEALFTLAMGPLPTIQSSGWVRFVAAGWLLCGSLFLAGMLASSEQINGRSFSIDAFRKLDYYIRN